MNKPSYKQHSFEDYKIQASFLLKAFHSTDNDKRTQALKRFQRLPEFSTLSYDDILKGDIKRKHALAVIALENGFKSWIDLKSQTYLFSGGFLNKWFSNYAEAKSHRESAGGFLLPYKNQFYICDADYITHIGLDPYDPDWKLIAWDWIKPNDRTAWLRLNKKLNAANGGK